MKSWKLQSWRFPAEHGGAEEKRKPRPLRDLAVYLVAGQSGVRVFVDQSIDLSFDAGELLRHLDGGHHLVINLPRVTGNRERDLAQLLEILHQRLRDILRLV